MDANVYTGRNLDRLPPILTPIVKVFLSSTFDDYAIERNFLFEKVVPPLRDELIRKFGFDFILTEMRWGILEKNCYITTQLCLSEIIRCQQESIAVNFIGMLSRRYGTRFLLEEIPKDEFELVMNALSKENEEKLRLVYELDDNDLDTKLYKIKSNDELIIALNVDKNELWDTTQKFVKEIQGAVSRLLNKKQITQECFNNYMYSVTEKEIWIGALNQNVDRSKVFFIFRSSNLISNNDNDKEMMEDLKNKVANTYHDQTFQLSVENHMVYDEVYLGMLKTIFENEILKSVENAVKRIQKLSENDKEIVHHWNIYKRLTANFNEREEYSNRINDFLKNQSRKFLVIYGPSGIGKSSILANTVKKALGANMIVIARFLGTSRYSSNEKSVLMSVIYQLNKIDSNFPVDYEPNISIRELNKHIITNIDKIVGKKIVFVFDAIDQIDEQEFDLDFVFSNLPKNVKVIYSILTRNDTNIGERSLNFLYNNLRQILPASESEFIEVESFNKEIASQILKQWLNQKKRQLTRDQWLSVSSLLERQNISALHLKLIFDLVSKWKSTYCPYDLLNKKCLTATNTIEHMFNTLENIHGRVFLSHTFFYMSLLNGISEQEIEDILSIDDEVLINVFEYHEPPLRRFPFSLWLRLKNDLSEYLAEREAGGVKVIGWYHRCFWEASEVYVEKVFHELRNNKTLIAYKDELIQNVLDYFIETWNKMPKTFKHSREVTRKLNNNEYGMANRFTKTQQMIYYSHDGSIIGYNQRKVNEFVRLIGKISDQSIQINFLLNHVFFNYGFMYALMQNIENNSFFIDIKNNFINKWRLNEINKKQIELLTNINTLYKVNFRAFQVYPDSIAKEFFIRYFDNRDALVQQFKKGYEVHQRAKKSCSFIPIFTDNIRKDLNEEIIFTSKTDNLSTWWVPRSPFHFAFENQNVYGLKRFFAINDETISVLSGNIQDNFSFIRPYLHSFPLDSFTKLKEFDGGIFYSKVNSQNSLFRKSFGEDREVLVKEFYESITNVFMVSKYKVMVVKNESIELVNFLNGQTLAAYNSKIYSNKLMYELVYLPEFDSVPTYIISFKNRNSQNKNEIIIPKYLDECILYEIENINNSEKDFLENRAYSVEHAAVYGNYLDARSKFVFVFRDAVQKNTFYIGTATQPNCHLTIRRIELEPSSSKKNNLFGFSDFFMDDIILIYPSGQKIYYTRKNKLKKIKNGELNNFIFNDKSEPIKFLSKFEPNTVKSSFIKNKFYFKNEDCNLTKCHQIDSIDRSNNMPIADFKGFMDEDNFVLDFSDKRMCVYNALHNRERFFSVGSKSIEFVSKHFIVFDDDDSSDESSDISSDSSSNSSSDTTRLAIYFTNDVNLVNDPSNFQKLTLKIEAKIFKIKITGQNAKEIKIFYTKKGRKSKVYVKKISFNYALVDTDHSIRLSNRLSKVKSSSIDFALVGQISVILTKEYLEYCSLEDNSVPQRCVDVATFFGLDVASIESVELKQCEIKNKFIALFDLKNSSTKAFLIEISGGIRLKKSFELQSSDDLLTKQCYMCYYCNDKELIFYDLLSESIIDILRIEHSINLFAINDRYVLIHDDENFVCLYSYPDFKMHVCFSLNMDSDDMNICMNSKFVTFYNDDYISFESDEFQSNFTTIYKIEN